MIGENILNSRQNRSKNKLVPELVNQISHSYEQTVACDVMAHGTLICQLLKDSKQLTTLETRSELEPKCPPQWFLGLVLRTRWSAIGQYLPLSIVSVPEVFAKVSFSFPKTGIGDMVALCK